MERRRAGPQLIQPDPQQAQRVRVEDIWSSPRALG
jgi:hypothetical protein